MTQVLAFEFDVLPTSINAMWMPAIRNGKAIMIKTPEYRAWRTATAWEMRAQAKNKYMEGAYALHVELYAPDNISRDIDNFSFKALSDAAQDAGIIANDSHCRKLKSEWVSAEKANGKAVRAWFISTASE